MFESENNRTEISPKYQPGNAENMSIEIVRECNQSVRKLDNNENIQHKREKNNLIDLSGDNKLTTSESTDNYSANNENISTGIESEYSKEDNNFFIAIDDDEESKENNQEETNDEFEYNDHESYESDATNNEDVFQY